MPPEGEAFPYRKRTRWNNRKAGRGRYPGVGVIRVFNENYINLLFYNPRIQGRFDSFDAVLAEIKQKKG